jgi:hypothetical protein
MRLPGSGDRPERGIRAQRGRVSTLLVALLAAGAGGCEIDSSVPDVPGCGACPDGRCVDGGCVRDPMPRDAAPDGQPDPDLDADVEDASEERCREGAVQACYDGPPGSELHAPCAPGMRTCVAGAWGECAEQVVPRAERCNARDDDCDGAVDEAFDLQQDGEHCGVCDNACASGQRCCGGECADLRADDDHCGACGTSCDGGEQCCDGACVDPQTDSEHCGPSCVRCGGGQACCSGACANLSSFQHCGECGNACDASELCCSGTCTAAVNCL